MQKEDSPQDIHFRILLGVHHSRNRDTKVGDGAPEVCIQQLLVTLYILAIP